MSHEAAGCFRDRLHDPGLLQAKITTGKKTTNARHILLAEGGGGFSISMEG